jgi:FkbM family methyltransferase
MKNSIFQLLRRVGKWLGGKGLGLAKLPLAMSAYEYFYSKLAPEGAVLVEVHGQKMYVNAADKPLGRSLITTGAYEKTETEIFRSVLKPGMTVVDIGANVGYYTLIAASMVEPSGRVYAFEPEPANYELLTRNIAANGHQNVLASPEAVSNTSGSIKLYIDSQNFGNRSFSQANIVHNGGAVDVNTTSLDILWSSGKIANEIDVMKIDAQGAEGFIVEGAQKILREQRPKILMEFEPGMLQNNGTDPLGLIEELKSYGYGVKLIDIELNGLRPVETRDLLAECEKNGYIDLFLEK